VTAPRVSVITVTYNQARYLTEAIESVQSQTMTEWEQIVVDDGSTDETQDAMARIKDPRIIYIREKHKGISSLYKLYNIGLEESRSPFIAILEGDDRWPMHKLETQVTLHCKSESVLSYGKVGILDSFGREIPFKRRLPSNLKILNNDPPGQILKYFVFDNFIAAATVLINKLSLLEIGGFQQPVGVPAVDAATFARLSLAGTFLYIDQKLGFWRRHLRSVTTNTLTVQHVQAGIRFNLQLLRNAKINGRLPTALDNLDLILAESAEKLIGYNYTCIGRNLLVRREWDSSKSAFWEGFKRGSIPVKMLSLFGLCASFARKDLENLTRLFGIMPIIID
jgi:glycosyltransferase involved in cell wall biosynthesis